MDEREHIFGEAMDSIKKLWLQKGAPRVPKNIEAEIKKHYWRKAEPWEE
jgi:hypothetical protein